MGVGCTEKILITKALRYRYTFVMLSVSEYAREANLSTARVRSLAASGQIPSKKLGHQWVILSPPHERFKPGGRLLSQRSLDALSWFLEGAEETLPPHEKNRARLRAQQLRREKMAWIDRHLLRAGERVKTYAVSPSVLGQISESGGVRPTGTSDENTHVFGSLLHAYVPAKKLRKIELVYSLKEVSLSEANLILRVVDSLPQMSKLRLICDLAFEQDPRAYAESRHMLEKFLEGDF